MSKLQSRKITIALFVFYLLVLSGFVLFKTKLSFTFFHLNFVFYTPDIERSINLVPFGGMLVLNGKPSYHEIYYNALVFVPFGILLCMLRSKKSFIGLVMPIFLTSLFFEVFQYVFVLGASDITDLIANTLGGAFGILVFFTLQRLCKAKVYQVVNGIALVLAALFVAVVLIAVRPM